jgi:hypothetical protein
MSFDLSVGRKLQSDHPHEVEVLSHTSAKEKKENTSSEGTYAML